MIERISSGAASLDVVLGGGLPANSIALIAGAPGTGKTILAQQFTFAAGTVERPALYLTTASEPLEKVVRFGQALDFFDSSAVGSRVIYDTLGDVLAEGGLPATMDRLVQMLATVRPGFLVIDSFRAIRSFAEGELQYRQFVSELGRRLSSIAVTTIWAGEYDDEVLNVTEAAVADVILGMRTTKLERRTIRYLEVLKLRGGASLSGEHAYRLGSGGIHVFPRLADPVDMAGSRPPHERISLGSDQLDALTSGGVWPGTSTLVIGPSGAGKTMLALDFLIRGAADNRSGVFATLQESRAQFGRMLWGDEGRTPFSSRIVFHHRSPVDIYIDEWVQELFDIATRTSAELLVIDSLSDLRLASGEVKRFEEYIYSLVQRLALGGITSVMTLESAPVFTLAEIQNTTLSNLADNIVLLGYQMASGRVERVLHVLKTRASGHDDAIRRVSIGPDGLTVGDPVDIALD